MAQGLKKAVKEKDVRLVTEINELVNQGVLCNDGRLRKFDVLDYYERTSMSMKKFNVLCIEVLTGIDTKKIKQFIKSNFESLKINDEDVEMILNQHDEVRCEKDDRGYPIPGTGTIITNQEKLGIINYLKKLRVPLTYGTYYAAFRRYVNGYLIISLEYLDADDEKLERPVISLRK